tara:strand:+ start:383 stop:1594 length:1212 start_codon:yes stop_codon:yes gene_type:complete
MKNLTDKKILLIICGGISAYKSLELIRSLKKNGAIVKTILTKSGKEFVTPLSITSLSQEKVYEDLFSVENESEMDHISLSRWCDIVLVAPITANTISKLSNGNAEDLASTVILASNKNIMICPAMNVRMWEHPTTKNNLEKLKQFGYKVIGPEVGDMACGEYGEGKMTEPSVILEYISKYFEKINKVKNKKFKALITAGPTKEFIDPVRFITNRSSGKQGYEIAKSFYKKGFETTLISGPTNIKIEPGINLLKVETAEEMLRATQNSLPADVAVFSAAVADYKTKKIEHNKIKKNDNLNLSLEKNIDILSLVSNHNLYRPRIVIGFAAETENLEKNSLKKLSEKNCDWVISNDVSDNTIGFDSDYNEVTIYYKDKSKNKEFLSKRNKAQIADMITEKVIYDLN